MHPGKIVRKIMFLFLNDPMYRQQQQFHRLFLMAYGCCKNDACSIDSYNHTDTDKNKQTEIDGYKYKDR